MDMMWIEVHPLLVSVGVDDEIACQANGLLRTWPVA